ncbi:PAS domain-containing protein [Christensenellaceae bacterium OttesenSCG-928-M15]|nr:PAS domain-containing protein [Christensenellaceae bacterium OttesenSCG-928-M15]
MSKEILDALCRAAEALAIMFGRNCEAVVHDFTDKECRIVAIYNGHVSGRTPESTKTIYGLSITSQDVKEIIPDTDYVNTVVTTPSGKALKTSSINFIGEGYHYVLGVNYDSSALTAMQVILKDMLQSEQSFEKSALVDRKLSDAMDYCFSIINKEPDKLNKSDRMRIVSLLYENDIFSIQKAVPYVSERLGVSRYTIYNYLNELKTQ